MADDATAQQLLAPLRELGPELDTFERVPTASLIRLHMDPEGPTPIVSATAAVDELPAEGIDAFLAAAGPGSESHLTIVELRQLGGALAVPAQGAGAIPQLPGQFLAFAAAIAATPEVGAEGDQQSHALMATLAPWSSGKEYLNFAESSIDTSRGYERSSWDAIARSQERLGPGERIHRQPRHPAARRPLSRPTRRQRSRRPAGTPTP